MLHASLLGFVMLNGRRQLARLSRPVVGDCVLRSPTTTPPPIKVPNGHLPSVCGAAKPTASGFLRRSQSHFHFHMDVRKC